ncbi:hypothetical protein [Enterococcus rivorum]|nr:hypothetical protein [Enterococcus rivorum]MBP2100548.1 hypothetical protein [Enterococcus rivorum]
MNFIVMDEQTMQLLDSVEDQELSTLKNSFISKLTQWFQEL